MNFENILVDQENGLATITINRPKKLNALNKATIEELNEALQGLEEDNSVKVVIITGSGEKAFIAGADISEFAHFTVENGGILAAKGQELVFDYIENFSKYNELYGSIGALLILMFYLWLNSNILLLGFELNMSLNKLHKSNR